MGKAQHRQGLKWLGGELVDKDTDPADVEKLKKKQKNTDELVRKNATARMKARIADMNKAAPKPNPRAKR